MTDWQKFHEGLTILRHYIPNNAKQYLAAEHDVIYVAEESSQIAPIQQFDKVRLERLGFHLDADNACWVYFC